LGFARVASKANGGDRAAVQTDHGSNVLDNNTEQAQEGRDTVSISRLDGVAAFNAAGAALVGRGRVASGNGNSEDCEHQEDVDGGGRETVEHFWRCVEGLEEGFRTGGRAVVGC